MSHERCEAAVSVDAALDAAWEAYHALPKEDHDRRAAALLQIGQLEAKNADWETAERYMESEKYKRAAFYALQLVRKLLKEMGQ
jgi:hypothetical protein